MPWEWAAQSEGPLGCSGRRSSAWSAFGKGDTASVWAKDMVSAIELPCSPVEEQRHWLKAANSGASCVLKFTKILELLPLCGHRTTAWDKPVPATAWEDPSLEGHCGSKPQGSPKCVGL